MKINIKVCLAYGLIGANLLTACSSEDGEGQIEVDEATAAGNQAYAPTPEYSQKDGDTYVYVGDLSDEERQQGKSATVVSFRNLGLLGDVHTLEIIGDNDASMGTFECSAPCRVGKRTDVYGRVTREAVERDTILAAAFRDAANGLMEVAIDRRLEEVGSTSYSFGSASGSGPNQPSQSASGFRHPDFKGRDREFSMYRTRIVEGMREEGANFAGNFTIIRIGCGTGCTFNLAANRATGEVHDLPYGGEEQQMLSLRHSVDSNIVNASWFADGACVTQRARWTGSGFQVDGDPKSSLESVCNE